MTDVAVEPVHLPFRPRARLLQLLGDQLIGSPRLAVFELVKNAYDADANEVSVRLDLDGDAPTIVVEDDGEGMTLETLRDVWLVPGDDHREKQRKALARSARHRRLPLGEKGLGRFAVHKLGNEIRLITRAANSEECVIEIVWNDLIEKQFLSQAPVTIRVRQPEHFVGDRTGARIEISDLRQKTWTRGEIRRLQRQITSICSPFTGPGSFKAKLAVPGYERWIEDIPDIDGILERAFWRFTFRLENGVFEWNYEFLGVPGLKLDSRRAGNPADKLRLPPSADDRDDKKKVVATPDSTEGLGPVSGRFYVYDRDREVLEILPETQLLTEYLDENGGVRIYRDGIRVYNYGEPGDDWLGLDLRRVNRPTRGVSRNIVIGAIDLSLEASTSLVEKTNREGFVEGDALDRLRRIVLGALAALESERSKDKDRIRQLTAKDPGSKTESLRKPIDELRRELDRRGIRETLEPYVARIEHDFRDMQETLLSAGMSGLNLAVVFHEVERGVRVLHQALSQGVDLNDAALQARELMQLLDGFSMILRRDAKKEHSARKLISAARQFNILRLRHHRVRLSCPLLQANQEGFATKFSFGLVLNALNNLIDNSLYWMRVRWPDVAADADGSPRVLHIDVADDLGPAPAIIVADTGPGFGSDTPEEIMRPFFTRKPSGMGLGLYYANLAMELNGGQLVFPKREDLDLPDNIDGAIVGLVFGASK